MNKRILIVEDQPDIRKLIAMTLEIGDYEIHEADSGDSGFRMAQALKPHVMLLDVMMPGSMDGLQVCSRLKSSPDAAMLKVILLTARGQKADIEAGRQAGADAYLTKPFSPLELMDKVDEFLAPDAGVAA